MSQIEGLFIFMESKSFDDIYELGIEIKRKVGKLTPFESLQIASNSILADKLSDLNTTLKSAFVVSPDNSYPSALEAIAIQLGFKK